MTQDSARIRIRVAATLSLVVAGGAALLFSQCKTTAPFPEASLQSAEGGQDDLDKRSFRLVAQGGRFKVQLANSGRKFKAGDQIQVRYGVVQKFDSEPYACNGLDKSATVVLKDEGKYLSFPVDVSADAFKRCQNTDPTRKLSLECQNSGDWDGPKKLEICVTGSDGELVVGRAVPTVESRGFNLDTGELLEHIDDVINYGKVCAQRLGPLPRDWSCLDGEIIPITQNGVEIPFDQHQKHQKCDRPPYLGLGDQGNCVPYARLGRLYTAPDVETVFICRRYNIFKPDGSRYGIDEPLFQDVAVIQHSVKTGETCYYQALSGFRNGKDLPAVRIPPPDEERVPDDILDKYTKRTLADGSPNPHYVEPKYQPEPSLGFWIKPSAPGNNGFDCTICHDSDPYMHSPYVDQLNYTYPQGHPFAGKLDKMVPCDPGPADKIKDPECIFLKNGRNYSKGKYSLVHEIHQKWRMPVHVAPKNDDTCVRCHRLGSLNTCRVWARDSVGGKYVRREERTDYSFSFPESHWMPITGEFYKSWDKRTCKPNPEDPDNPIGCEMNLLQWRQAFEEAAEKVLECCNLHRINSSSFASKCVSEPIVEPPPPTGGHRAKILQAADLPVEIRDYDESAQQPGVTRIGLSPAIDESGDLRHVKVALQIDHDSHTNLRIWLRKGEKRVLVWDGQEEGYPGASGELNVNFNSADNYDRFRNLVGEDVRGDWTLEIEDRKPFETGAVTDVEVTVSYN